MNSTCSTPLPVSFKPNEDISTSTELNHNSESVSKKRTRFSTLPDETFDDSKESLSNQRPHGKPAVMEAEKGGVLHIKQEVPHVTYYHEESRQSRVTKSISSDRLSHAEESEKGIRNSATEENTIGQGDSSQVKSSYPLVKDESLVTPARPRRHRRSKGTPNTLLAEPLLTSPDPSTEPTSTESFACARKDFALDTGTRTTGSVSARSTDMSVLMATGAFDPSSRDERCFLPSSDPRVPADVLLLPACEDLIGFANTYPQNGPPLTTPASLLSMSSFEASSTKKRGSTDALTEETNSVKRFDSTQRPRTAPTFAAVLQNLTTPARLPSNSSCDVSSVNKRSSNNALAEETNSVTRSDRTQRPRTAPTFAAVLQNTISYDADDFDDDFWNQDWVKSPKLSIKACKCSRSRCLKLYCDCFRQGLLCGPACQCRDCQNLETLCGPTGVRTDALRTIANRRPGAFALTRSEMKIPILSGEEERRCKELVNSTQLTDRPCKCKKSQCLKLYCDCFQRGLLCDEMCECRKCLNQEERCKANGERALAIKNIMEKRPGAFEIRVKKPLGRGCACKTNRCLKKYCLCRMSKSKCNIRCRCTNCQNIPNRPGPRSPKGASVEAPPEENQIKSLGLAEIQDPEDIWEV